MAARDFMAIFISSAARLCRGRVGILQSLSQHHRGMALNLERRQVFEGERDKVRAPGNEQPIRQAWQMHEQ